MAHTEISQVERQPALAPFLRKQLLYCKIIGELTTHSELLQQVQEEFKRLQQQMEVLIRDFRGPNAFGVTWKQRLLSLLLLDPQPFGFTIELKSPLANPLCRGKYSFIEVCLASSFLCLPTTEVLPLSLSFYTAEDQPKLITTNMDGQPFQKGRSTVLLAFNSLEGMHTATFKIQVNEVTSHFRNGWIFMVIVAENSEFMQQLGYGVQPLVLEHIVVKAKATTCERWRQQGIVTDISPDQFR